MVAAASMERSVKSRILTVLLMPLLLAPLPALAALYAVVVEGLGAKRSMRRSSTSRSRSSRPHRSRSPAAARCVRSWGRTRRATMQSHLRALAKVVKRDDHVAVYLIGHGSFDGTEFKFNMPGPDLTGQDLRRLLDALPTENQLVVSTGSASGSLADVLKKESRVLITATPQRQRAQRDALRRRLRGGLRAWGGYGQERQHQRAGGLRLRVAPRRGFLQARYPDRIPNVRAHRRHACGAVHGRAAAIRNPGAPIGQSGKAAAGRGARCRQRAHRGAAAAQGTDRGGRVSRGAREALLLELAAAEEKIEALDGAAQPQPGAASGGGNAP